MPCGENIQLCCVVCRIVFCSIARCMCCRRKAAPKKEYQMICIGLTRAGKTTVLSALCHEAIDDIVPTTGFSIKPCQFKDCILNIKEIGGGEKQRPYWKHYYHNVQAVVFVVDSASSDEEITVAREALHESLSHPALEGLPCLILGNCQDKPGARNTSQLSDSLRLETVPQSLHYQLSLCSAVNEPAGVRQIFESFIDNCLIVDQVSALTV